MNDFNQCNKISGIYWLKKSKRNLSLRVKLKSQNEITALPKFEDYSEPPNISNLENTVVEFACKWQEKVFSKWEAQRYADHHNCITEAELNYHETIKNTDQKSSKIFTYVHNDYYLPLPSDSNKYKNGGILNLESQLARLSLKDPAEKLLGSSRSTASMIPLFKSQENVHMEQEDWTAMHVVLDNSDYIEDSELVYKQEVPLVSVYHNTSQDYMIITPDVNNLELNPYTVETSSGVQLGYQYAIEIQFDDVEPGDDLLMLLRKLYKRWERKQKHMLNFYMPSIGSKLYYITLEILSAREFDTRNLYVEFDIKVPEGLQCNDILHGCTHTSEPVTIESEDEWSFGHVVEFTIESDSRIETPAVKLFFEAISSDWWDRHRTEGYAYFPLPLTPGCYTKELACKCPEELNTVEANSRRFFLGGCHLIKDLNVLVDSQLKDANFSYTSTGTISLRWNIISQCQVGGISSTVSDPTYGVSTASALLRGAEIALNKYQRARARLAAATGHLADS